MRMPRDGDPRRAHLTVKGTFLGTERFFAASVATSVAVYLPLRRPEALRTSTPGPALVNARVVVPADT